MTEKTIGSYIKLHVIPAGMSVSEAARKLDVARPTLSNLLNGKTALSAEMAAKLQRVFKADKDALLERQAKLDSGASIEDAVKNEAKKQAAGYLDIPSSEIAEWAAKPCNRTSLPTLVRRLVDETGSQLTYRDFPGEDDGERTGWDGTTKADSSSAWVPAGTTLWELSCSSDLPGKPTRDIEKRASEMTARERQETTFIFICGKRWSGKANWADTQKAKWGWKDVLVRDADLLSQWLEQSASTQIWLSERMGKRIGSERSIEQIWIDWAEVTDPPFPKALFQDQIDQQQGRLTEWLKSSPHKPLIMVGDSKEEVLAHLACALDVTDKETARFASSAVVVSTELSMRRVGSALFGGLIIVDDPDAERVCSQFAKHNHIIIVRPRNSVENDPDIAIGQISSEAFHGGLAEIGKSDDEIDRLARESGRSLTILRRRLSHIPEIKAPVWASDKDDLVKKLKPFLFAGAWNDSNDDDIVILELLSGVQYAEMQSQFTDLLSVNDPAVWSLGNYKGVISRKDALFTAKRAITDQDIKTFLDVATLVLSEEDPSLDLDSSERWNASVFGKTRRISGALREAIGEMLILLSVYGDQLFNSRLPSVPRRVDHLVASLLNGQPKSWMNQRHDLRKLAEASPEAFLSAIERDLESGQPQILEMLRPVSSAVFDSPDRTDLLWALETLAWSDQYYQRVGLILAKMSVVEIQDNWVNKPINSLGSLIRFWWPQTSVDVGKRIALLKLIVARHPAIGWELCLSQIDTRFQSASANVLPRWRDYGASERRSTTGKEEHEMRLAAANLALDFEPLDWEKLAQLIQNVRTFGDEYRPRVWARAEQWIAAGQSDDDKAVLKNALRKSMRLSFEEDDDAESIKAKLLSFIDKLEPEDLVAKHQWLFAEHWVQESWDEITNETLDYNEREKRISAKRSEALEHLYNELGLSGVDRMLAQSEACWSVGFYLAKATISVEQQRDCASYFLKDFDNPKSFECLRGFITCLSELRRSELFELFQNEGHDTLIKLLKSYPCEPHSWNLAASVGPKFETDYWKEALPLYMRFEPEELNQMLRMLVSVDRPRAAFSVGHLDLEKVEPRLLAQIVQSFLTSAEPAEQYQLRGYELARAFSILNEQKVLPQQEMAKLEYLFFRALDHTEYGTPNLERQIADNPTEFVNLVCLLFKRDDGAEDPPEHRWADNVENKQQIGENIFRVLEDISRIPGSEDDGRIDPVRLIAWVKEVRSQLRKLARVDVGDSRIGNYLAKAPTGDDGIWPHPALRIALEEVGTEKMSRGLEVGVYNSRGVHSRGPNGDQERALAAKYRGWSNQLEDQYPFTARMLENIAQGYDHDAKWHDTDEAVRRRLGRY